MGFLVIATVAIILLILVVMVKNRQELQVSTSRKHVTVCNRSLATFDSHNISMSVTCMSLAALG